MNDKITLPNRSLFSLIICTLLGGALLAVGIALFGNQPEVFDDLTVWHVAVLGTNETGELRVFWAVMLLMIPVLLGINWLTARHSKREANMSAIAFIETALLSANILYFLAYGDFLWLACVFAVLAFFIFVISPKRLLDGLGFSILLYFGIFCIWAVCRFLGLPYGLDLKLVTILAGFLTIFVVAADKKHDTLLNRAVLLVQLIIPFGILTYCCEKYAVNGEILNSSLPIVAKCLLYGFIAFSEIFILIKIFKSWGKVREKSAKNLISIYSVIIVAILCSVDFMVGKILPPDLVHPAENVITYQQLDLGQQLYDDYAPTSGLFAYPIGLTLKLLGGGLTNYYLAHALFMMVFVAITVFLLSRHVNNLYCLFIVSLFFISASSTFLFKNYDRGVLILPTLLTLALPSIIKRKNLWLKLWIVFSVIGVLYYSSFGMATALGLSPFAAIQALSLVSDKKFKRVISNWRFWAGWAVVFVPIILLAPTIIKLLKHTAVYAVQTNLADGMSMFGKDVPDKFLPFMSSLPAWVTSISWCVLNYIIPMVTVWIIILLIFYFLKRNNSSVKIFNLLQTQKFMMLSTMLTFLIVGLSSSMVVSSDPPTSRAAFIIVPVFCIFLFMFGIKFFHQKTSSAIILGVCIGISLLVGGSPLSPLNTQPTFAYELADDYQQIDEVTSSKLPLLGDGFAKSENLNYFLDKSLKLTPLLEYEPNLRFASIGSMSLYYVLNIKSTLQPRIQAVKDYSTHKELIDGIKQYPTIIGIDFEDGDTITVSRYYLYRWLMTNNDYVYSKEHDVFMPKELFAKIYGDGYPITDNREVELTSTQVGRVANSLGKSLTHLEKRLTQALVSTSVKDLKVTLQEPIPGEKVDMLYLKLSLPKNVYADSIGARLNNFFSKNLQNDTIDVAITWGDGPNDHMSCTLGSGELLIPLGANSSWLLNDHKDFSITIPPQYDNIKIEELKLYQLNANF